MDSELCMYGHLHDLVFFSHATKRSPGMWREVGMAAANGGGGGYSTSGHGAHSPRCLLKFRQSDMHVQHPLVFVHYMGN
jgi:hypothetical protein